MATNPRWLAFALLATLVPGAAAAAATPAEIVEAAPAPSWAEIDPARMMVMELADGATVVIELAPEFAPVHVANIVRLVEAGWFDGTSINRVQDNYVVQWGDASEAKPLPPRMVASPPAEYERPSAGLPFVPLGFRDAYAEATGHSASWPVASDGERSWLVHCYGMVGAGRDLPPDSGTGAELYAVIGHAPRHLDRNIALVGRVLAGIEALAARPRGTGALGFYTDSTQRIGIRRVRLASAIAAAERPRFEVMRSNAPSFGEWVRARASRSDSFFVRPAGALDICNALAPVRRIDRAR